MRILFLVTSLLFTSCKSTSFSGQTGKGAANTEKPGNRTPSQAPGTDDSTCIDKVLPVRVVFVLDVTTSMAADLHTVTQNVMAFASRLEEVKFRGASGKVPVQLGLVQFTDRIFSTVPLTTPESFASRVKNLDVEDDGNVDFPESGLMAVDAAAKMLQQAEMTQGEGLPIVVLVTDALAHDGSGSPQFRSCEISALNSLTSHAALKRLAIYDSSPSVMMATNPYGMRVPLPDAMAYCAPYRGGVGSGPDTQWKDIRTRVLKNRPGSGASLGYPFSAQSLLTAIPRDLENTWRVCN